MSGEREVNFPQCISGQSVVTMVHSAMGIIHHESCAGYVIITTAQYKNTRGGSRNHSN